MLITLQCIELGATVISLSDSRGALVATDSKGFTPEDVEQIARIKVQRGYLTDLYDSHFSSRFKYLPGERPWKHVGKVDVALPSATQNEVSGDEAEALVSNGCQFIAEGSNMGCTKEAIDVFEGSRIKAASNSSTPCFYAPGKAANAVSSLRLLGAKKTLMLA
jgi:glutamate dehydrogenase (NADP+)